MYKPAYFTLDTNTYQPAFTTHDLSVGTSLSITSGSGTGAVLVALTVNTIQDIGTTASPTWATVTLNTLNIQDAGESSISTITGDGSGDMILSVVGTGRFVFQGQTGGSGRYTPELILGTVGSGHTVTLCI